MKPKQKLKSKQSPYYDLKFGDGKYVTKRRIGAGSFGELFVVCRLRDSKEFAMKIESTKAKHPQLWYESKLYKLFGNIDGIPKLHAAGTENDVNYMVLDLQGPSLENVFQQCNRSFSLKTVIYLALDTIDLLQKLHSLNYLHRDIKPDNFLIGRGTEVNKTYMIDFGLSKKYRDPTTNEHIKYRENKSLTGTSRYASINSHLGREHSRRDDLESLGYVLMYFLRGSLPWQGLIANSRKHKYDLISQKKRETSVEELCANFPIELVLYFNYVKILGFEEEPNYDYLKKLFWDIFVKHKFVDDRVMDWMVAASSAPDSHHQQQQHTSVNNTAEAVLLGKTTSAIALAAAAVQQQQQNTLASYANIDTNPPPAATKAV